MDNNKVIYDLLDEMFQYQYKGIKWYCHNFGGFDSVFIINALVAYNKYSNDIKYEMKFLDRKGSIIKLLVKKIICLPSTNSTNENEEKKQSVYTLEIRDSYTILPLAKRQN
jgi:hypothetical protein